MTEKYIEGNPLNPEREEEIRINKGDIKPKKWSRTGYVPLEQIGEDHPENQVEAEVSEGEIDLTEGQEGRFEDPHEEILKEKRRLQQLETEIKFQQREGAASLYTEEEKPEDHMEYLIPEPEKELDEFEFVVNEDTPRVSKRKTDILVTSMSPERSVNNYENRKDLKRDIDKAAGHENLKTLNPSKKNRSFRKAIRDFFTKQNYQETPTHKKEEYFVNDLFADHVSEPKLNGKPLDKKFYENEEDDLAA